ncbi:MAG TPA: squalene--hopene cyclase [Chthoniobacterales bacterium]|nr:squalene--hopene cyclase [Chthoniobacterales bacterium]
MNRSTDVINLPSVRTIPSHPDAAVDAEISRAITKAQENLLRQQRPDGHWCGELMVDSTLCSDFVLFMHWANEVDVEIQERCVQHILKRQLPDGGWNIYYGGPSEINACVKAYFALKLAGISPDAPFMHDARANILRLGGIPKINTFSKLYLALMGQFPWQYLPTIPVEMVLLPSWAPFHMYKMSSWSRAMLVPLAVINHFKPTRVLPGEKQLHELYPLGTEHSDFRLPRSERFWTWRNFFLRVDEVLKFLHPLNFRPMRRPALAEAERWMLERIGEGSDGLATVFPAMLNCMIALRCLGYTSEDAVYAKAQKDFAGLFVDDPEDFRIQPCLSPIWDTAINMIALAESGLPPEHPSLRKAAQWLVDKEVRIRGDWAVNNPYPEASGWAFEYNNVYYPDTDDTAMVLMALRLAAPSDQASLNQLFKRAVGWQLSFQCRDGGWAAFDKDVTTPWLEDMPFADHNAILDPTCSDLTARTLEMLGYIGFDPDAPCVRSALKYLIDTQEDDGSWYGRWGVNYIYGTWQVLRGLRAIGQDMTQDWILRGRDWLESCQNADGGWGETCATYENPAVKGKGDSTASQTAWALMGICACGDLERPSIQRALRFLLSSQSPDGSWAESEITGTGFPRVFYLKYDLYRQNFPLLALATYANYRENRGHPAGFYRCPE